jgi:hypothetical protein
MSAVKYSALISLVLSTFCFAQSTPSEFAAMSLDELFDMDIYENRVTSPWIFTYQFKTVEFDGYLDGTEALSDDEVLWNAPNEPRSAKNFPVVPTTIIQKAHILALDYQFSAQWAGHLAIPYLQQTTDHISIVKNYESFTLKTEGLGDVSVSARYNGDITEAVTWWFSFGLSLPTGSIDESGDTPREPGDQQLPYTMQLGSGTYDFPLQLGYQFRGTHDVNVSLAALIRTGTNDRHYRLGNTYSLNGRYKFDLSPTLEPYIGLDFQYSRSIHGQDDTLLLNGPFPYPASITNPELYGGKKISLGLGLLWQVGKDYRLNVEMGKPIYQDLNGPQPKEKWRSAISISKAL